MLGLQHGPHPCKSIFETAYATPDCKRGRFFGEFRRCVIHSSSVCHYKYEINFFHRHFVPRLFTSRSTRILLTTCSTRTKITFEMKIDFSPSLHRTVHAALSISEAFHGFKMSTNFQGRFGGIQQIGAKMGLPPARATTVSGAGNLGSRRRLSRFLRTHRSRPKKAGQFPPRGSLVLMGLYACLG